MKFHFVCILTAWIMSASSLSAQRIYDRGSDEEAEIMRYRKILSETGSRSCNISLLYFSVIENDTVKVLQNSQHFDPAGRMIKDVQHKGAMVFKTQDYIYDSAGNLTQFSEKDSTGSTVILKHFEYTSAGNIARESIRDATLQLRLYYVVHTYDDEGKRVEAAITDSSGILLRKTVYSYNQSKKITKTEDMLAYGQLMGVVKYTYDSEGRITETDELSPTGYSKGKVSYAYDSEGRLFREAFFAVTGAPYMTYVYDYNADGYISIQTEYDARGNENQKIIFGYLPSGLLSTETWFDNFGNITHKIIYEYGH